MEGEHDALLASQVAASEVRFASDQKSRSIPINPKTGRLIPRTQRWGYDVFSWDNTQLKSLTFDIVAVSSFVAFNSSQYGHDCYTWLNDNYTPFQINFWWTFGM